MTFITADLIPHLRHVIRVLSNPATVQLLVYRATDGRSGFAANTVLVNGGPYRTMVPAPALAPDLLPGLTDAQRRTKGSRDAARYYNDHGAFWASLGSALYAGPLLGVVAPAIMAPHAVSAKNLHAPHPELLADPAYGHAYRQQAQRTKRGRAWGGYGVGVAAWVVLIVSLVSGGQ